jgi:hypothetical protein
MDASTIPRGDRRGLKSATRRDAGDESKASERFEFRTLRMWRLLGCYGSIDGYLRNRSTKRNRKFLFRSLAAEVERVELQQDI